MAGGEAGNAVTAIRGPVLTYTGDAFLDGLDATMRYEPDGIDGDEASERLLQHLQQDGRVMLSGTRIDGRFHIRCAILSFRSHVEHVDEAIDALVRATAGGLSE